jgi:hypothetical protein
MINVNLVDEIIMALDPEMTHCERAAFLDDHGIVDEVIPLHTTARGILVNSGLVSEYCNLCIRLGEPVFDIEQLRLDEAFERVANHSAHVDRFERSNMGFGY